MSKLLSINEAYTITGNYPRQIEAVRHEAWVSQAVLIDLANLIGIDLVIALDALDVNSNNMPQTLAFLNNKVKPYLAYCVQIAVVQEWGINTTQAGMTTPTDPQGTYRPASERDRAILQNRYEALKASAAQNILSTVTGK